VSCEIKDLFPDCAVTVAVGRRCGFGTTPYRIHPDIVAHALAGRSVARVKAGDPFVFGRGGEEIEGLLANGIPYEVIPGITAALGAAASAGIPLTHRGISSSVTFATGHDADGFNTRSCDWSMFGKGEGTLVLYMAARRVAANVARLVANGCPQETPVAYVASATRSNQRLIIGTLHSIAEDLKGRTDSSPAVLVIGKVVKSMSTRKNRLKRSLRTEESDHDFELAYPLESNRSRKSN
jgi:uroporphyrinogen III methyltransferase/synthase